MERERECRAVPRSPDGGLSDSPLERRARARCAGAREATVGGGARTRGTGDSPPRRGACRRGGADPETGTTRAREVGRTGPVTHHAPGTGEGTGTPQTGPVRRHASPPAAKTLSGSGGRPRAVSGAGDRAEPGGGGAHDDPAQREKNDREDDQGQVRALPHEGDDRQSPRGSRPPEADSPSSSRRTSRREIVRPGPAAPSPPSTRRRPRASSSVRGARTPPERSRRSRRLLPTP
jgi:hypothetical protein